MSKNKETVISDDILKEVFNKPWKTPFNDVNPTQPEINRKPSMTIPDQSMSVQEIMERYARGLPIAGQKVPLYDGEEGDFPDLSKMDLADRQQYLEDRRDELSDIKYRWEQDKIRKAKKQQEKFEFEQWKKDKAKGIAPAQPPAGASESAKADS